MILKALGGVLILFSGFVLTVLAVYFSAKLIVTYWLFSLIFGIVGWLAGLLLVNWGTKTANWPKKNKRN